MVRTRSSENQMFMFTTISVVALAAMLLLPSPRAAFGAVEAEDVVVNVQPAAPTADRLSVPTAADRLCAGQVWGVETLDCVLAIARDGGIDRPVRLADAGYRH